MSIYTNNLNFLKDENAQQKWDRSLTIDGPISHSYDSASPKILWILKEPHQDKEARGKSTEDEKSLIDYAYCIEKQVLSGHTYRVMIKVSKGLLHNIDRYNELSYNQKIDGPVLRNTAIINLNKTGGGSKESKDYKRIAESKLKLVKEQISMLKPDIVICGGTYEVLKKKNIFENLEPRGWFEPVESSGRLIIPAYHPGYPYSHEEYFNKVIHAWNEFRTSR